MVTRQNVEVSENFHGSGLRQELEELTHLYSAQPLIVQRFLEQQARHVEIGLRNNSSQIKFVLPDRIIEPGKPRQAEHILVVHVDDREQMAGGVLNRLARQDSRSTLLSRLAELEQNDDHTLAVAGKLMRFAIAHSIVYQILPEGRAVKYIAEEGEEIPSIPIGGEIKSALTASTDAIVEEVAESDRGDLLVPYVPAARRFYLPQWVAFDDQNQLLVGSIAEAEAHIASMQKFLGLLHTSVAIAPYFVADEAYQRKRYGILGQLVNQGRAMAFYQAVEIVKTIQRRAHSNDLNRGLSIDLPYFDDQNLVLKTYFFEIIPAGRIMFVPAFVVRASRLEQAKVAQDTRLSSSTRKNFLKVLQILEKAFIDE